MEIDGFSEIISSITLAKELHDIGRDSVIAEQFSDTLCWDNNYENILGTISSVFSKFYNHYDDSSEEELMIFQDDVISQYFEMAWLLGNKTNIPHHKNPYVIQAENEIRKYLDFCYGIDLNILGYTKTKKAARQSKLIISICSYGCDCHDRLAFGLIQLYKWFSDQIQNQKTDGGVAI